MEGALVQLRAVARSLYSSQPSTEEAAADAWMRAFVGQEGAWRALVALLAHTASSPDERALAACSLRPLCLRQRSMVEPEAAPQLARLLAEQLAAAVTAGCSHTCNQCAAALATLAVRCPDWPPEALVTQLIDLAAGTLAAANVPAEQQQLALLRLLAALAEAALAREASMHPQRRQALLAALLAAPQAMAAVQQALAGAPASASASVAALQLLQAWCGLGAPPAGAEAPAAVWRHLHRAVLHPDLSTAAAEAAAALYACCCLPAEESNARGGGGRAARKASSGAGGSSGSPELVQRRRRVFSVLLPQLPAFAEALQESLQQAQGQQAQGQLLCAGLAVLGAAAQAADSQACNSSATEAEAAAQAVHFAAELALAALQHPAHDVTLAALQHLDEQIERWQAAAVAEQQHQKQGAESSPGHSACAPLQRQALLGRLCGALLQRMALPACLPLACATADARDLPSSVQLVRREVGDTFRGAVDALGPQQARQQLLQLAGEALAAWRAAGGGGAHWQHLECCLFALNLVWARQRSTQEEEAAPEVRQAAGIAAAALSPAASKLAGTALTLLGGMAEQLPVVEQEQQQAAQQAAPQQQAPLGQLLSLVLLLVRNRGDDKLSRNAATCCQRLTACRPLAALLAARHAGWADALCACFAEAGGMQERARDGANLSSAQFLLASVCQLAAAAAEMGAAAAAPNGPGSSSSDGGRQLLLHLLSHPAAAAEAALAAAAAAPVGSAQRAHHLEAAALQIETVAVAVESVAGSGSSSMREQLPHLVGSLGPMVQHAAAAAAQPPGQHDREEQQQQQQQGQHVMLQALCRLAAAVAGTPAAALGLQLVAPFTAAPQHPCVLQALAMLTSGSRGSDAAGDLQLQLAAALRQATQAAAATRSGDADWQMPILQLGEACVQHQPAVAADAATLDALLHTAERSMLSWHRDVCEAALRFAESLLCVGCQQRRGGSKSAGAAAPPPAASSAAAAAEQHLQSRLDEGRLGASLLLRLLLAASGAMPPYMVVPIADALHRCWRTVGDARFGAWLRSAALGSAAPDEAPWRRWKPEAAAAAVVDLLSSQNVGDPRRFKRLLKVFCGGKKKGTHVEQPARGA
ncbi:hypothetical protein C2E20_3887 [Micractinium conductrix]|uniref:Uncharacterized protein n=1 Tax=Micractinium conductrix TaxID=554055 RepID=A0A2P6VFB1_9CHLO|nr:hypothetical protein C2E20_3887 [Micractinium conductrix]|eukprot:PSC72785.1 hypothetical protein C2E20_3887 [Micractinium conductrix]